MKNAFKRILSLIVIFSLIFTNISIISADSIDGSNLTDDTLNKTFKGGISSDGTTDLALSADYSTEVFDNGDGTFSYYVIRNTTVKQADFMKNKVPEITSDMERGHLLYADKGDFTMNYLPVPDDAKFQDVTLWVNPEVEVLSADIVNSNNNDSSTVNIEKNGTQQIVKWKASHSNDTKIKFLNDSTNPFLPWIDIPPLSTLKVVVKPKEKYTGSILPFKSVVGKGKYYLFSGPNSPSEIKYDKAFIRGFVVKNEVKPIITTTFYKKDFSVEVEEIEKGQTVGIKYVIGNPNNVDIINFVQNLALKNVTIDGVASTDIKKDVDFNLTGLSGKTEIVIQGTLVANSDTEAVATAKVIQKFVSNKAPATHILDSDADKNLGNIDSLGNKKYFRYRPEDKIDDDNVFPALEGQIFDIEEQEFLQNWIYGYKNRNENGYKPGISAFDTDYIYNGTNTVTDKEVIATDKDTLKVKKIGKIIVKYIEEGTNKSLTGALTQTGIIESDYTTKQKTFEGYDFVKVQDNNVTGKFKEKEQTIIYIYKKITKEEPKVVKKVTKWMIDKTTTELKDSVIAKDFKGKDTFDGYEFVKTVKISETETIHYFKKVEKDTPKKPETPKKPITHSGGGGGYAQPIKKTLPDVCPNISGVQTKKEECTPKPTPKKEKPQKPLFSNSKISGNLFKKYPTILPQTGVWNKRFKRVGVVHAGALKEVTIDLPNWRAFKNAGSKNNDLNFWLTSVPHQDRNRNTYIVLPTQGLVMPINEISTESVEAKRFFQGSNENFWKYLLTGAASLPGTSLGDFGEKGNKVIAAHSSYWKTSTARYKTHFQRIIEMDNGQEIWIYKRNSATGKFARYIYKVQKSYNTDPSDISVIKPTETASITLFTCTPIGGAEGRWVVRGIFVKKD